MVAAQGPTASEKSELHAPSILYGVVALGIAPRHRRVPEHPRRLRSTQPITGRSGSTAWSGPARWAARWPARSSLRSSERRSARRSSSSQRWSSTVVASALAAFLLSGVAPVFALALGGWIPGPAPGRGAGLRLDRAARRTGCQPGPVVRTLRDAVPDHVGGRCGDRGDPHEPRGRVRARADRLGVRDVHLRRRAPRRSPAIGRGADPSRAQRQSRSKRRRTCSSGAARQQAGGSVARSFWGRIRPGRRHAPPSG